MLFPYEIEFAIIRAQEPKKSEWNAGLASHQRIAYVALVKSATNLLMEVLVDLVKGSIISKSDLPSIIPPETEREEKRAKEAFLKDPRVIAAYNRRGLNPIYAQCELWAIGASGLSPGKHFLRAIAYYQEPPAEYYDWRPVEGLQAIIDTSEMVIYTLLDNETEPIAPVRRILNVPTNILKPLLITQSQGSSIRVRGQQIQWYKWKLMYSMDPIHGLQLFHVRYQGDCEERPVLYKISISEMLVPYGAEGEQWRWRRAFDAGEYGLGLNASPSIIGQDVPENTILLNCTTSDSYGKSTEIAGCIAAYERDAGLLYKHTEYTRPGQKNGRRGRQMVLSSISTVGNYDYIYEYILHMDGTLQVNVRLTGIPLPRGVSSKENDATCIESCATLVNDYLIAPTHQHFFNYRMDLDVDGPENYAIQVDVTNDPIGPDNPDGGAFSPKKKIIHSETARDYNVRQSRSWQVINAQSRNRFYTPRGYAIKPLDMAYSFSYSQNPYTPQSEFTSHPFWVTAYKDEEQAAASNFPRTGAPYQGLPEFIADKQPLQNTDVVAWYTFGLTHTTRPGEWPFMNVHNAGFSLVPYNFLSQNSEVPLKAGCP